MVSHSRENIRIFSRSTSLLYSKNLMIFYNFFPNLYHSYQSICSSLNLDSIAHPALTTTPSRDENTSGISRWSSLARGLLASWRHRMSGRCVWKGNGKVWSTYFFVFVLFVVGNGLLSHWLNIVGGRYQTWYITSFLQFQKIPNHYTPTLMSSLTLSNLHWPFPS